MIEDFNEKIFRKKHCIRVSKNSNKKVLLVGNFLSKTINYRGMCEDLAVKLEDSGWQVITTSGQLNRFLRLIDMIRTTWSQRSRYHVAQVDVYSGLSFFWAETVCWILRLLKKPYVLTLRGGNLPSFSMRWPGRVRRLLESSNAVTVPSRYLQEKMCHYRNDIRLIPNAIDLEAYSFRLRERVFPHLVWLRAFHEIYNPTLAPKILAKISKEFPDARLIMVGPDKGDGSFQKTQQLAVELGVNDRITFPGVIQKKDVPVWLNKGDIFLNTTNVDNAPVSILEAMASGLCIVSTNVGGIPYLLEHEHDALLVAPKNLPAMTNAVRRILTEAGLAERISSNARKKAEEFHWSIIVPQWDLLLKSGAECLK